MADHILYFSELLGLSVFDVRQRVLGKVRDAALVPVNHPVRIDRFLIGGGGWTWLSVRYDQVKSISLDGIFLSDERLVPYHTDDYVLRMERDLLDQQIIDAKGRKVVRVNDVTFEIRQEDGRDTLTILEVDIGVRSIFRRLVQGVLPRRMVRRLQSRIAPNSIRWELCNILEPDPQRRLRLNITTDLLEQMHPADLADIVEELSPDDREAIFEAMEPEAAAETLSEVEPEIQAQIIESLETEVAADILEEMEPDEAADVLAELEEETSEEILEEMEHEPKEEVRELMEYAQDTAGGIMNTSYVALPEGTTVAGALAHLRSLEEVPDSLTTLFVIDAEGKLLHTISLARVFVAPPEQSLAELGTDSPQSVNAGEEAKRIVELFDKYNLLALPVIDDDNRLAGMITADDVITLLRAESR